MLVRPLAGCSDGNFRELDKRKPTKAGFLLVGY
jgi:hypothetical protein